MLHTIQADFYRLFRSSGNSPYPTTMQYCMGQHRYLCSLYDSLNCSYLCKFYSWDCRLGPPYRFLP